MKHLALSLSLLLGSAVHATEDCHVQGGPLHCPAGTVPLIAVPGSFPNPEQPEEVCGFCAAPGLIDALQCTETTGGHWCELRYLHFGAHYEYTVSNQLGTHPLNPTGHSLFVPCANEAQLVVARWIINGDSFASAQTLAGCIASF